MARHVKYVDFELQVVQINFGYTIVDANCLQILGDKPLLAISFYDATFSHFAVANTYDFDSQGLFYFGHLFFGWFSIYNERNRRGEFQEYALSVNRCCHGY
ncbi:hypothetical protein BpHYR1_052944 [Brachionus plicatilis]|uniref:Uncharacterized protein n=1 Tax=Brachionus plicatilis TaxID=10195 RepID=A0A3M7RT26_BRAPC|nr:hypothetical protein BpHYR1_052944 [Brachionus plicatilis]